MRQFSEHSVVDSLLFAVGPDGSLIPLEVDGSHAVRVAVNDKLVVTIASVSKVNGSSDQYLGMYDLSAAKFHDIVLEVKIQQPVTADDSAKDFKLFWAFCSEELTNPAQAPTVLQPAEYSLTCDLVDASGGATTRFYQTPILQPKAPYIYCWYDCDYVHEQLNYSNLNGAFQVGETVTGGTSGATGTIESDTGSSMIIQLNSGQFQVGETITGGTSGATATVDEITALIVDVRLIAVT